MMSSIAKLLRGSFYRFNDGIEPFNMVAFLVKESITGVFVELVTIMG